MSDINMDEHDIIVYDSSATPKWDEKIIQASRELVVNPHEPIGRLDQKLVMLPLKVIVLLMSTIICSLDLILRHIRNILITQYGKQQLKKSFILSKRMRHGNWFPFLPRGSLSNASGSSEPKLLLMVQM